MTTTARVWDSSPVPFTSALAVAIFVGRLVMLLLRPRRVPDWAAALGGGVLLVVVGVLPLGDALGQLAASWNVFLFFLGLGRALVQQLHEYLASVAEACAWLTGTPPPPPRKQQVGRPESHRKRRWDRLTLEQQLVLNAAGTLYRDALWWNPSALDYLHQRALFGLTGLPGLPLSATRTASTPPGRAQSPG